MKFFINYLRIKNMSENIKSVVLSKDKIKKEHKFRDTVMIRVRRDLRDQLKKESERTFETMSQIIDYALKDYFDSIKPLD